METNFNQPFKDYKGNPFAGTNMADEVCKVLFTVGLGNDQATADDKYMAYKLCNRIMQHPEKVELSADEMAYLIRLCGEKLSAGAYGQVKDLVEGRE